MIPNVVFAGRGCCSHHGGVAGCHSSGKQICNDGTLSPSCTCTPAVTYIYGCTDSNAKNYNSSANKDNGSCQYYTYGCTDKEASNYNSNAEKDDGSCEYYVYGCMDSKAQNYNKEANKDDGNCEYLTFNDEDDDIKGIDVIVKDNNLEETSEGNPFLGLLVLGAGGYGIYKFANKKKKKS